MNTRVPTNPNNTATATLSYSYTRQDTPRAHVLNFSKIRGNGGLCSPSLLENGLTSHTNAFATTGRSPGPGPSSSTSPFTEGSGSMSSFNPYAERTKEKRKKEKKKRVECFFLKRRACSWTNLSFEAELRWPVLLLFTSQQLRVRCRRPKNPSSPLQQHQLHGLGHIHTAGWCRNIYFVLSARP